MDKKISFAKDLIDYINKSYTMFHSVENMKESLKKKGFKELDIKSDWKLKKNSKYFTTYNKSFLCAFCIGDGDFNNNGFKIIGAHTDSPGLKLKPYPEINFKNSYIKLNTEVYGGPILSTWFDRPLSIAGKVALKKKGKLYPEIKLINFDKDLLVLPNLAIHMNRSVNDEGYAYNKQKDLMPILTLINNESKKDNLLNNMISENLNCKTSDILSYELFLYSREKGKIVGLDDEFISSGKLDNLAMFHAGVNALLDSDCSDSINVVAGFDNEEVGSHSSQGADSPMLKFILERIYISLGKSRDEYLQTLANSFIISADMAHGIHPNFEEKSDPVNMPILNSGPVLKIASSQAYTTNATSEAVFENLCDKAEIPCQKFVNHSNSKGGSTIGPITSSQLGILSVDVGNPIFAMHSIKELGGVDDHFMMYQVFKTFFK